MTNAVAFIKVTDPVASVYGVVDYRLAVRNLVQTALRSIVGEMTLDDALSSRENIKTKLRGMVADDMTAWALPSKRLRYKTFNLPHPCNKRWNNKPPPSATARRWSPAPRAPSNRLYWRPKDVWNQPNETPKPKSHWRMPVKKPFCWCARLPMMNRCLILSSRTTICGSDQKHGRFGKRKIRCPTGGFTKRRARSYLT